MSFSNDKPTLLAPFMDTLLDHVYENDYHLVKSFRSNLVSATVFVDGAETKDLRLCIHVSPTKSGKPNIFVGFATVYQNFDATVLDFYRGRIKSKKEFSLTAFECSHFKVHEEPKGVYNMPRDDIKGEEKHEYYVFVDDCWDSFSNHINSFVKEFENDEI